MSDMGMIMWLAGFTILAALVFGIWQFGRAQTAKRNNEHSAMTKPGERRVESR